MIKVSVIVPVFNTGEYLGKCLSSLAGQTLDDIEIIVVNDGSSDGSREIIGDFESKHPGKVVALSQENKGPGPARNLGIEVARGEYVGFADSDDWVAPDMFELMYRAAKAEDADVAICDYYMVDEASGVCRAEEIWRRYNGGPGLIAEAVLYSTNPAIACNKLFKSHFVKETGFISGYYEDLATIPVILSKCGKIAVLPEPLYYYFKRRGSITSQQNNPKNLNVIKAWERCLTECNPEYRAEMAYAVYFSLCFYLDFRNEHLAEFIDFFRMRKNSFRDNRYIEEKVQGRKLADLFVAEASMVTGQAPAGAAVQEPDPFGQTISDFLKETAPLLEQLDALPFDTAAELYDMYESAAKAATQNIAEIDPELRVRLCDGMDDILDRIADFAPELPRAGRNGIYAAAMENNRWWNNADLMKDCGLVPYTVAKETGMRPVMFYGSSAESYPYLEILPGLEVLCTDAAPGTLGIYLEHLAENYAQIDALALYGVYSNATKYLDAYRKLRPDGKVYCSLDMNSDWMGRLGWGNKLIKRYCGQCDVLATSCRPVRDALNRNTEVAFPCHWITNGFYNPTGAEIVADPDVKENIILTVGRIGIKEKNNEELLTAFAAVADSLPGWTLRLVGRVDPRIEPFIESYFMRYPQLKERVIFTGAIIDKAGLFSEYAKAKIFTLTSLWEGFPNVYAEALHHGCMFVTSGIEAADDMIGFGELGVKYNVGDINALSAAFAKMCSKADRSAFERHIPKALAYANKYFDWSRNARKIAYMLFR